MNRSPLKNFLDGVIIKTMTGYSSYGSLSQQNIQVAQVDTTTIPILFKRADDMRIVSGNLENIKDDLANLELLVKEQEQEDFWDLLSVNIPANTEMIKSMEKSAEAARAETAMLQAQAELDRQRRVKDMQRWASVRIEDKVATYGEIETFTGLTDLTEEQLKHLRRVVESNVSIADMKKNKRAAELVKKWVTPEEWEQLLKKGGVNIKSKKHKHRYYWVSTTPSERVKVYENGKVEMLICGVDADSSYADGDKVLNKIISLKEDEDHYIKNSHVSRTWA